MGDALRGQQRERRRQVGAGEQHAAAHAVRGVQGAHDPRVVHDGHEVRDARVRTPAPGPRVLGRIVPVLGVQTRDHLRYAGRAPGELEDGDVVGRDRALHVRHGRAGGPRVDGVAQRVERHAALGVTDDQHVAQRGVVTPLFDGEGDQVEPGQLGLHQVRNRPHLPADLGDLMAAVRDQRGHRHQSGLEHRVPGRDDREPVGHLEQHGIPRRQAEVEQTARHAVGVLVELAVGEAPVQGDDRGAVGMRLRHRVHFVGEGAGAPEPGGAVALHAVVRVGDDPTIPVLHTVPPFTMAPR